MKITWFSKLPIAQKVRILFVLGGLLCITCFGGIYIYYGAYTVSRAQAQSMLQTLSLLGERNIAAIRFNAKDSANEFLRASIDTDPSYRLVCLYDTHGGVFAAFPPVVPERPCPTPTLQHDGFFEEYSSNSSDYFTAIRNIVADGQVVGAIYALRDTSAVKEFIWSQLKTMFAIAPISMIFCYFIAGYLQRVISNPIISITNDAKMLVNRSCQDTYLITKREDELGQLAEAFNKIIRVMDSRFQDTVHRHEKLLAAYRLNMRTYEKLIEDFEVTAGAFTTYTDMTMQHVFGPSVQAYFEYQTDVLESLSNHTIKLEGFQRLAKIYERSIQTQKVRVDLQEYLASFIVSLKQHLPFLSLIYPKEKQEPLILQLHKEAWDEIFLILRGLYYSMIGIVQFVPELEVLVDSVGGELRLTFKEKRSASTPATPNTTTQEEEGALADLLAKANMPFARDYHAPEAPYRKNSIEDPYMADEFLSEEALQRPQLQYILESLSYIANANAIGVQHYFEPRNFTLHFFLERSLNTAPLPFTKETLLA